MPVEAKSVYFDACLLHNIMQTDALFELSTRLE